MIRPSRLILGAVLLISAACTATPTAPQPRADAMAPDPAPSFDETNDCRGGWTNPNGKSC